MSRASRPQDGHVAVLLCLSIVVAISVISAGVVGVGMGDTRRIANELRRTEAHAAAENVLDRAAMFLWLNTARVRGDWMAPGHERWRVCDGSIAGEPCIAESGAEQESFDARWSAYGPLAELFAPHEPIAQNADAYFVARAENPGSPTPGWSTIHVIAEGRSRDGTARARLRRSYQLRPLVLRLPDAPLVTQTGAASLVGNVALSVEDGVPPQSINADGDALSLLFGAAANDPAALRTWTTRHADCAGLGPDSQGLLWIEGDCVLPIDRTVGSAAKPVILVVDAGHARMDAPFDFYGILVLRSPSGAATGLAQSNGPSAIHGAIVADGDVELVAENLSLRYDAAILQPLLQLAGPLSEVPGSWSDHR